MFATEVTLEGVCQAGICPDVNVRTCPLVPAARNAVVLAAVWYGTEPAAPPVMFATDVGAVAFVQAGIWLEFSVNTWPLVPAAKNEVAFGAD
jgi:hypothetical protein